LENHNRKLIKTETINTEDIVEFWLVKESSSL